MARITISDLHPSSDTQNVNELHDWEMKTVEGGVVTRRRPTPETSVNATDANNEINNTLNNLNGLLSNYRSQIDQTIYSLRDQLGNL